MQARVPQEVGASPTKGREGTSAEPCCRLAAGWDVAGYCPSAGWLAAGGCWLSTGWLLAGCCLAGWLVSDWLAEAGGLAATADWLWVTG